MKISDVLRKKGSEVITIKPDETVAGLLGLLAEHRIGAVVVSTDGSSVDGIVSERDIVRHLHSTGTSVLEAPVSQIMTSEVTTGSADDNIADLAGTMTEMRVRHVPIVDADGRLAAIVSIGDIVKHRLSELQSERDQLRDYISS
ncbi:histidine kinase [Terrabacter sp. Soil811]|uniref:CBS domain-containing protein n=1 Tax=Terrabacter sp. Soil811 TaxID=1736419 RepID=UPI0006F882A8|nr:CBS domain-containing protein [Terrabacter sp. Soil811]KRF48828.1 histidine kinase [Terrabacter sp. Soil811]